MFKSKNIYIFKVEKKTEKREKFLSTSLGIYFTKLIELLIARLDIF